MLFSKNQKILFCISSLMILSGCNLNLNQTKLIAKNSGLAAAVTWISYDNPEKEQIDTLLTLLEQIQIVATSEESTYGEILFPLIEDNLGDFVENGKVSSKDVPIILAGSLAILNGLDLLIMSNPKWEENTSATIEVVNSFVDGAKNGLSLSDNDPRVVKARQSNSERARFFNKL